MVSEAARGAVSLPERDTHEELAREILRPFWYRLFLVVIEVNVQHDYGEDHGQCADHQDYRKVHGCKRIKEKNYTRDDPKHPLNCEH